MISTRSMRRYVSELRFLPVVEVCPLVYSKRQLASNGVKPVIVTVFLPLVHLIDRHCGSRHAARKHLITGDISSTDLPCKVLH